MECVAYLSLSFIEENEIQQRKLIKNNGYKITKEFIDKYTGRHTNRTALSDMLNFIGEKDTVVIEGFNRLSKSTRDLLSLIQTFEMKKVKLISLKENFDSTEDNGKKLIHLLQKFSEFEKELLKERQREGILLAKAAGKYKGRKRIARTETINKFLDRYLFPNSIDQYSLKILKTDTGLKNNTLSKFLKIRKEEILQPSNAS